MGRMRLDWRWAAVIALLLVLANSRSLPWFAVSAALAAAGGYILYLAWQIVSPRARSTSNGRRVTYWRGQRIETATPPAARPALRLPSWREVAPASIHIVVGLGLILGAATIALRAFGL